MKNVRKSVALHDIGGDARRQYMDVKTTFTEWGRSVKSVADVRGGMYWKRRGMNDACLSG